MREGQGRMAEGREGPVGSTRSPWFWFSCNPGVRAPRTEAHTPASTRVYSHVHTPFHSLLFWNTLASASADPISLSLSLSLSLSHTHTHTHTRARAAALTRPAQRHPTTPPSYCRSRGDPSGRVGRGMGNREGETPLLLSPPLSQAKGLEGKAQMPGRNRAGCKVTLQNEIPVWCLLKMPALFLDVRCG